MPEKREVSESQPRLTKALIGILSAASGIAVANIYYLQPLLSQMAADYHITQSSAGLVATLTQIGFAFGLLFLLPLADIVEKRRLIITVLIGSSCSLTFLYFSPNLLSASIASFAVGFTSILPQLLIPLGAQLAKPEERGKVIGSIMSGLLTGILLSRVVGGLVGKYFGWKTIYLIAAFLMLGLMAILRFRLPKCYALSQIRYRESLKSIPLLVKHFSALRESSVIGAMIFCAFSAFWTALTFLLQGPHYRLGADAAGLFGLVGIIGALFSPVAGRISDKKGARFSVGINIVIIILSFLVFYISGYRIAGLIIGVILLDLGVQCCNVSNQTRIQHLNEEARNRVTAIYMISYFLGGALGSYLGALGFQYFNWAGVCALGFISQGIAAGRFFYGRKKNA